MASSINHHASDQEFTVSQNGYVGELAYSKPQQGIIDFTHTYVDEGLRGQGVAEELARAGLTYAKEQQLKVRTSCEFMDSFVRRHPEYNELLDGDR
ncbi:N-acetyltransferase [Hymenobacter sediminis]|uniref:GNAT family N-acetyltransferase n=1 Tax=Hymenobacter sediminis TaxID=2218621 RepID=UPI000DA6A648|nr:GNAT family N-acetyltransferase [Hymenobacter sediminis]RPD45020.1 N-acetyltransferase [Hymenobacter sediminis]